MTQVLIAVGVLVIALAVAAALPSVIAAVMGFVGLRLFEGPSVQEA